jgi:membrane-bound acyltransferase YfiQ involved in biofilm formation
MILKWRWFFIASAILLFPPNYLLAIESNCWIISVFAFAYRYLNHPSKALDYLSQAAYPVYILHMIFLYLGSLLIFPLNIPSPVQYPLLLLFTLAGCFASYEYLVRRINIIRPLFGLRMRRQVATPVVATK